MFIITAYFDKLYIYGYHLGLYIIRCKLSVSTYAVEFVRKITKNVQYTQVFNQKSLVNVFFFVIYQQIWLFFPHKWSIYICRDVSGDLLCSFRLLLRRL